MKTVKQALIDFLMEQNAFWKWDGHKHVAQLSSGKLSDFFANCTPLFTDPEQQDIVAEDILIDTQLSATDDLKNVWVIGSAMGAIGLAQSFARHLICSAGFTEPAEETGHGPDEYPEQVREVMKLRRFDLGEKPYVVLCEDVITTGGTTLKTIEGIREKHPDVRFHHDILAIVNRSGEAELDGLRIVAEIDISAKVWDTVDDLPDNMKGCIPIRPKANWRALADEKL